jgi:GxxExxY protein
MPNLIKDFLYEKESKIIYDACHEVWREFGGSFKESVVDKSLTIALKSKGLKVDNQKRIELCFKGEKVGTYLIDLVIDDKIIIELKCKIYLTAEDIKQFWRYLKATNYKLGFLINFNPKEAEIIRRVYDTARETKVA